MDIPIQPERNCRSMRGHYLRIVQDIVVIAYSVITNSVHRPQPILLRDLWGYWLESGMPVVNRSFCLCHVSFSPYDRVQMPFLA
jgi:hypothetical protein